MPDPHNFMVVFIGGPFDGVESLATQDMDFPILLSKPIQKTTPPTVAVYEYDGNREGTESIQRVYRHFETMSKGDAAEFIAKHGGEDGNERERR